ncbi:MAG: hypothetical protein Q7S33_02910 [Nanoarchaeota archaeon]|nr:hypothetical protein [Nanoarchaeota archaeon]
MAEKNEIAKQELKHKGFFNFAELYTFCFEWLKDEGYKISEDNYTEKIAGNGKEIKLKWVAKKKISDYFRNEIELSWHVLGLTDAEIERDGKKEKTNKGELKIVFRGILVRDYESRWEDNPSYKFFRGIYDKYIIRTTMEEYEDKLKEKTENFVEQVKSFLTLEGKR